MRIQRLQLDGTRERPEVIGGCAHHGVDDCETCLARNLSARAALAPARATHALWRAHQSDRRA
jgi:hypothetical protein